MASEGCFAVDSLIEWITGRRMSQEREKENLDSALQSAVKEIERWEKLGLYPKLFTKQMTRNTLNKEGIRSYFIKTKTDSTYCAT